MHALHKTCFGIMGLVLPVISQAYAASVVTVTPPNGAVTTIVFGITEQNVIAGSFVDANGVEHGFFGPLNGTYTTFDFGGTSTGTEPRAISDHGVIDGFATDPNFAVGEEFTRATDGTITPFTKNNLPLDGIAQGVNKMGNSTGDYIDPNTNVRKGYLGENGLWLSDVNLGLTVTQTSPRGISKSGALSGFFLDSAGARHGFILANGATQVIDADSSGTTALESLNKKGFAAGQVIDSSGNPHSFTYDSTTGVFTAIDVGDGSTLQQAWGVNDNGLVAVSTSVASYIYCPQTQHCPKGARNIGEERSWHATAGSAVHQSRAVELVHGARQ